MIKHIARSILPVALIASLVTGCATIMAGGPDKVPVTSSPSGAQVFVDNQLVGATPTVVILDRGRSQGNIRIEAAGYEPVVMTRVKTINGWFWANLCIGGVIGIVIDLVTGDVKRFDDSGISVALVPSAGAPAPMPAAPAAPPAYVPPPPAGAPQ
jgi:hypothetical protein